MLLHFRLPVAALALLLCGVTTIFAAPPARPPWASRPYHETLDDPPAARAARADLKARSVPRKVRVGPYVSVQVNVDAQGLNITGDAANEPSIAVDPTNPQNIVIGWRQFDSVTSNFRQAGWAYSRDGGLTWTFPGVLEPGVFRSDPVLGEDASGRIFFQSLVLDFTVDVWRSLDAGSSWLAPVEAAGGDKNWMTVDTSGGIGDGHVYESYSLTLREGVCRDCEGAECCPEGEICCDGDECCLAGICCKIGTFVRSVDGGDSYEPPIPYVPGDLFGSRVNSMTLTVGPDGELYVAGEGFEEDLSPRLRVFRSDDAQNPGATPTFTSSVVDLGGFTGFRLPPNPGGLLGQVWIDVDRSDGPRRGNVYVLASVDPEGDDPMDVRFARSTDGGATWSAPVRVNDDPAGNGAWQWFGTMSVAPNGRLDAVWNDTRSSGVATVSELYYAYSWDGGETWSPNVPVSPPWDSTVGWPNQNKIGDYYDMSSDELGAAVAYAATLNGEQDVYFVRVFPDCNANGASDVADVAGGVSSDFDGDRVPDECEPMILAEPDPGVAGTFNTFTVADAFAGSKVRFLWSTAEGNAAVPACPGLESGLHKPKVLGEVFADAGGAASVSRMLAKKFAGQTLYFQAVDRSACRTSSVVTFTFPQDGGL